MEVGCREPNVEDVQSRQDLRYFELQYFGVEYILFSSSPSTLVSKKEEDLIFMITIE